MKKLLSCIVILGVVAIVGGCGNKSPQQVADQIKGKSNDTRDKLGIAGDWETSCSKTSSFGNFKSQKERYHFGDDATFQKKFFFFSDHNCQNPSFVRLEDGSLNFQGSTTPKEGLPTDFS